MGTIKINEESPAVVGILRELMKPQNRDLLIAVRDVGEGSDAQSFLFGFTQPPVQNFDDFATTSHVIDATLKTSLDLEPDLRSMSDRYDAYLADMEALSSGVALDNAMTQRFESIIAPFDDGWSGAYYAYLMRRIQHLIVKMFNN